MRHDEHSSCLTILRSRQQILPPCATNNSLLCTMKKTIPLLLLLDYCILLVLCNDALLRSLDADPVLHFTLRRRGRPFDSTGFATSDVDFAHLEQELIRTEARFNLTKREVKGNRLVRKSKENVSLGGKNEGRLMGDVAADGIW